jgi:hypothetical protein
MEMYLDMGHISGTYFWDIYEKSMEYMGTYLGNLWKITCIYICGTSYQYLLDMWEIYGKSMGNPWEIYGHGTYVWEIYEKYMNKMWDTLSIYGICGKY